MRWFFFNWSRRYDLERVISSWYVFLCLEPSGQFVQLFRIRFLHYFQKKQTVQNHPTIYKCPSTNIQIQDNTTSLSLSQYLSLFTSSYILESVWIIIIISIMLTGIRDHQSTLADSQRFYYSNYEYFNTYEDLQTEYQNDLSKIRFNLRRKSRGTIVLYDTHSSSYSQLPHQRILRGYQPLRTPHCAHIHEEHYTLDDLLFRFTQVFHQQNYSDLKADREDSKDKLDVVILKYMYTFFEAQFEETESQNFADLTQILEGLRDVGAEVRGRLELLYQRQGRAETSELLERWFAFEQYWNYLLDVKLIAESKNDKVENFYLFQFCQYFKYYLTQIGNGNMRNILLLAQPETPSLSEVVHPLSIPLAFSLKKRENPPKILFLNLDGRETYFNLRVANTFQENVRYISVFQEPLGVNITQTSLQKGCEEFQVDADFVNMNNAHSELLFREIRPKDVDGRPLPYNDNIILYPLNSLYLRRAYSIANQHKPLDQRKLPVLDSSVDMKWLWQEIISRQAEEWSPDLTIISYNGFLNISEEDFSEIVRDLTALSDHRIMLFTNMTGMFKPAEEMEEEMEEHPKDKIDLIREFLSHYVPYRYEQVDEEKYFNNLAQFVKISSGSYSLKKKITHSPHAKFSLGSRLLYLERLAQLPEYAQILHTGSQGVNMEKLFREFGKREIQQNRKESEWWGKKIEQIEAELKEIDPDSILEEEMEDDVSEQDRQARQRKREVAYRLKALKSELEVEELLVHGQMDTAAEFQDYMARRREKLLLDNLEGFHYRRAYTGEEDERGRLRCYRFCLNEGDGDQILLERYSQIITDEKKSRIFIINYRLVQQKHVILQGDILERGNYIKMRRVQFRLEETFEGMDINVERRSELIYVNYSYCFAKEKLYLFWPQEWNIEQELKRKLLGLEYHPPHINYMLRLSYNSQERVYIVEKLRWNENQGIPPVPRRGCVGLDISSDNRFYILGGIYDSRLDFYTTSAALNLTIIQDDTFTIQTVPKRKDRQSSKNNSLKPKMNYRIQKSSRTTEEGGSTLLSGGYGRSFTNFHTLFSQESYSVASELDGLKITRIQQKNARLTRLSQPLSVAAVGRFYVGSHGEGEEKFSDCVKDWVLAEGREQRAGEREVISVLEEEMRVREFKSDHKRNYLFGWDRTIRERIYVPHCWSPELQIIAGGKLYLVCTALKTEKSNNYNIGNFIIPKEEDLASLRLDEDRLLLLSNSPVLHSLDNRPNNYFLYEGSLANMTDLVTRRQLPMHERYEFKGPARQQQSLKYKTIFTLDDRIFLLGGLSKEQNQREDYILQRSKDKLRGKVRRLQCPEDSLELTSPVVVKHKDGFLLYSVILEQRTVPRGDSAQLIEDYWRLKIETFTPNQSCQEETLYTGPLLLYHLDFDKGTIISRRPQFEQPKIVKVIPYTKFSSSALRELIEKVYVKINRLQDEKFQPYLQVLREFVRERVEERLSVLLQEHHHRGTTFKELLAMFGFLLDSDRRERDDLESEELVRDLRSLSSLMNKHLIQSVLEPEGGDAPLHRFVIEDRSSRKVKFIAIGPLLTTRLRFLRIRYKHELSICLNETNEDELFFNTNILACEEIAKEKSKGASIDLEEEPTVKKIAVSYKA